ncbi:esterase-like activity of phytase family protein [soil metagenome]
MIGARKLIRLAAAAGIVVALAGAAAPPPAPEPGFTAIELTAKPIVDFLVGEKQTRFGALEFRGGLDLDSSNRDFGSWSGIDFAAAGKKFYAIADSGYWLRARLVEKDGALVGIEQAAIAPMLDKNGTRLAGKRNSDAEGLRVVLRNGRETALVSFEQVPSVAQFAANPDLALARRSDIRLPAFVNNIKRNAGLEALAVAPANGPLAGAVVVIAEKSLDDAGNHRGFILSGPAAGTFTIRRSDDFDVTDATFLPNGDLIVLERHFAFADGLGMRIRRIPGDTIRPGALLDGAALIRSAEFEQIDNMEGIAARTGPNGETLLTVISDDNHSLLQRTILLQFAIVPAAPLTLRTTSPPG